MASKIVPRSKQPAQDTASFGVGGNPFRDRELMAQFDDSIRHLQRVQKMQKRTGATEYVGTLEREQILAAREPDKLIRNANTLLENIAPFMPEPNELTAYFGAGNEANAKRLVNRVVRELVVIQKSINIIRDAFDYFTDEKIHEIVGRRATSGVAPKVSGNVITELEKTTLRDSNTIPKEARDGLAGPLQNIWDAVTRLGSELPQLVELFNIKDNNGKITPPEEHLARPEIVLLNTLLDLFTVNLNVNAPWLKKIWKIEELISPREKKQ